MTAVPGAAPPDAGLHATDAAPPDAGLHADAVTALTRWCPPRSAGQRALREAFLALLAACPDALRRSCAPGHLTASTVVLDADRRHVLLTLHPRVGRWLQLGGHCEDDATLVAAAAREAGEESGIAGLHVDPDPLHLDVHAITCSGILPTRHFDVRFLAFAPAGAEPVRSPESLDLRWWPVDALPNDGDTLPELVHLALTRC